jgi:hypothetical protein
VSWHTFAQNGNMEAAGSYIKTLNQLVEHDAPDLEHISKLLKELTNKFALRLVVVDLELNTHEYLQVLKQKKLDAARAMDFETAAHYRTLEDECALSLEIKESLRVESSGFRIENQFVLFFYFGKSQQEHAVIPILQPYSDNSRRKFSLL